MITAASLVIGFYNLSTSTRPQGSRSRSSFLTSQRQIWFIFRLVVQTQKAAASFVNTLWRVQVFLVGRVVYLPWLRSPWKGAFSYIINPYINCATVATRGCWNNSSVEKTLFVLSQLPKVEQWMIKDPRGPVRDFSHVVNGVQRHGGRALGEVCWHMVGWPLSAWSLPSYEPCPAVTYSTYNTTHSPHECSHTNVVHVSLWCRCH